MSTILLSINPEHVKNIFNGTKQYEFRKVRCKKEITKILIYSTSPIMEVVGEAAVEIILEDDPETVWKLTSDAAGIDLDFFNEYYLGKEKAVAYKLRDVKKYRSPKPLSDFGVSSAPQSFVYVNA